MEAYCAEPISARPAPPLPTTVVLLVSLSALLGVLPGAGALLFFSAYARRSARLHYITCSLAPCTHLPEAPS